MDMLGCPAHQITNHTKVAGNCSHEHAFYNFSSYDVSRPLSIGAVIVWIVVFIQISYRKSQSNSIKRVQKVSALLEVLRDWVSHSFPSTIGRHCFCLLRRTQQLRHHFGSRWYQKQPMKLDLRMLLLITNLLTTVSSSMSSLPNRHRFSTVVESTPSLNNYVYISFTEFKISATQMMLLHHSQINNYSGDRLSQWHGLWTGEVLQTLRSLVDEPSAQFVPKARLQSGYTVVTLLAF